MGGPSRFWYMLWNVFGMNFGLKSYTWRYLYFEPSAPHCLGPLADVFLVNFRVKWFLWHVHVHFHCAGTHKICAADFVWSWFAVFDMKIRYPHSFRLRRLAQTVVPVLVCDILPCTFSHSLVLVTCPCAFRLRRLAENGCRGLGLRHFTGIFLPWIVIFIMSMCMSTAQAASKELSRSWPFSLRFCRSFRLHSWRAVICEDFDRGLTEILVGGCCAHPDDILSLVLAWSCTWYARHILCVDMGQSSAKTPMLTRTFTWWQWFTLGGSHSRCPCKNFPALNGPRFGI